MGYWCIELHKCHCSKLVLVSLVLLALYHKISQQKLNRHGRRNGFDVYQDTDLDTDSLSAVSQLYRSVAHLSFISLIYLYI